MQLIIDSIKSGIDNAYFQNKKFKSELFDIQHSITEYLFTVNVAQELLKNNIQKHLPNVSIHLEFDAVDFINNAFDKFTWKKKGIEPFDNEMIRRLTHVTCREGRIDIALMNQKPGNIFNKRSLYGIEIKPLIRNYEYILKDLQRLTQALLETDPTGGNSIEKCYIGFAIKLHTKKKMFTQKDYDSNKKRFLKQLDDFLNMNCDGNSISSGITTFLLERNTAEQEANATPEEFWDSREIAVNSGAVLGVIIELKSK